MKPGAMAPLQPYFGDPNLSWLVNTLFPARVGDTDGGMRAFIGCLSITWRQASGGFGRLFEVRQVLWRFLGVQTNFLSFFVRMLGVGRDPTSATTSYVRMSAFADLMPYSSSLLSEPRRVPSPYRLFAGLFVVSLLMTVTACPAEQANSGETPAHQPAALELSVPSAFRFVAFGDARFHDALDTHPSNAAVREAIVAAVDQEHPSLISVGGDLVYDGENSRDWQVWDSETAVWRRDTIPVYPALGNHELRGNERAGLANYFRRFPQINGSRYYSLHAGNCLMLVLDSSLAETAGPQGEWLKRQIDALPVSIDFLFLVLHHPPYTSSKLSYFHGGHSVRPAEESLATMLETRQPQMHARIVVFASHVHNYERFEHGGVTYLVTGGGGAHPYIVRRRPNDLYRDPGVNYHYLLVEVTPDQVVVTMNKLEFRGDKQIWSKPDSVTVLANKNRPVPGPVH